MRTPLAAAFASILTLSTACGRQAEPNPESSTLSGGIASAPSFTRPAPFGSAAADPNRAAPSSAPTNTAAADDPSAVAPAPSGAAVAADPSAAALASASVDAGAALLPLPDVEVKNIGLHIGGAPNDNVTKAPVRDSVKPHFDAMRACYAKAKAPKKEETFGVDIRIPREGGKAKIDKPRTGLDGEGVTECLVIAFEAIDFKPPITKTPMMASYSVRFTRK
ncbi:MAG: hypothetical protein EXR75_06580 [Myxococcales bacterium]|nr:hypothetical protein [Myxococcales bacterium]